MNEPRMTPVPTNFYTSPTLSSPSSMQSYSASMSAPKLYATDSFLQKPELVGPPKPPTSEEMSVVIAQRDKQLSAYDESATLKSKFAPLIYVSKQVASKGAEKFATSVSQLKKTSANLFSDVINKPVSAIVLPISKQSNFISLKDNTTRLVDKSKSSALEPVYNLPVYNYFKSSSERFIEKPMSTIITPISERPIFSVLDESALAVKGKIESAEGMKIPSLGIDTKTISKVATAIVEPIPTFFETTFSALTRQTEIKGLNILDSIESKPYIATYHGTERMKAGYRDRADYIKYNILNKFDDLQLLGIASGAAKTTEMNQYKKEAQELLSERVAQNPQKIQKLKYNWIQIRAKPERIAGFSGRLAGYATGAALTSGTGFVPTTARQITQASFIARSESPKELATNIAIGAGFGFAGRAAQTSKGYLQRAVGESRLARGALEGTSFIVERAIKPYMGYRFISGVSDIGREYISGDKQLASKKERQLTTALATIPLGKPIGERFFDYSVGLLTYDPNVYVEPVFPSRDRTQIAREHLSGKVREGTRAEAPYEGFKTLTIRDPAAVPGKGVTYKKELAFVNPKMDGSKVQPVGSYFIQKSQPTTIGEAFSGRKSARILKIKYQTPNIENTKLGKDIITQLETKGRVSDTTIQQYLKVVQTLADSTGKPVGALSPKTLKGMGSSPTESEITLIFPKGQGTVFGVPGTESAGRNIDLPNLKFTGVSADTRTPVYSVDFSDTKPTYAVGIEKTQYNLAKTPVSRFISRLIPSLDTRTTSVAYYSNDGIIPSRTSKTTLDRLKSNLEKSKPFDIKTFFERPGLVISRSDNILSDYEKAVNLKLAVLTGTEKSIPGFYELNKKGLGHGSEVYSELLKMRADPKHPYYKTLNQFTKDELFKLSLVHDAGQIGTTPGYFEHGRVVGTLIDQGRVNLIKDLPIDKQLAFAEAVSGHMSIAPLSAVSSKIKTPTIKDIGQGFLSGNLSKALADADKFARAGGNVDTRLIFSRQGLTSKKDLVGSRLSEFKSGKLNSFTNKNIIKSENFAYKPIYNEYAPTKLITRPDYVPKVAEESYEFVPKTTDYIYKPLTSDKTNYTYKKSEPKTIVEYYSPSYDSDYSFIGYKPYTPTKYDPTPTPSYRPDYGSDYSFIGYTPYTPTGYYPTPPPGYTPYTPTKYSPYPKTTTKPPAQVKAVGSVSPKDQQIMNEKAFNIEVKSKGKWKKIEGLKKKNFYAAHAKAMQMVDNYAERSYRLIPTNKTAEIKRYSMPLSIFKFYRESKTKDPTLKDAWIEKSKYAIDSTGELKGITWKGIAAQQQKRRSTQWI